MKEKLIFIPSLCALFITAALALAFPYFLKELTGAPADAFQFASLQGKSLDTSAMMLKLNGVMIKLAAALCLQAFIAFFRVQGFILSCERSLNALRKMLFDHLVHLPMPYFQDQRAGAVSNSITSDLAVVRDTILNTVPQAARQIVIMLGGLVFIFIASWKLSLIMLGCVPIVVLLIAIFGKKVRAHSKAAQEALTESSTITEETIQGITEVKAFAQEHHEVARYDTALQAFLGITMRGARARAAFLSFIIFALFGTIAFVVWYGARMLTNHEITSSQFMSFILFSIFVGASLGSMPEIFSQFQLTRGAADRLQALANQAQEAGGSLTSWHLKKELRFKNLNFAYPSRPETTVLHDLSFSVKAGQRIALVGPSGAGKSTVFSLLLGFHQAQAGDIWLDEINQKDLQLKALRKNMAIVPQEVLLFGGSIRDNVIYGQFDASDEAVWEAIRQANAYEFVSALPDGLNTLVGPRGTKLSGGQRQRIAIARAILANPEILLLDEATSALDAESEKLVNEALERLMQGRTCLVIAHRLSTVKDADQILVFKQGRVVETGTHSELLSANGTYRLLVDTQLS